MNKKNQQLHNAFRRGMILQGWRNVVNVGNKKYFPLWGTEYLIYYVKSYYSIFVSEREKIQKKFSQKLVRRKQVGELSYRGFEILRFEGLLSKEDLIGDRIF